MVTETWLMLAYDYNNQRWNVNNDDATDVHGLKMIKGQTRAIWCKIMQSWSLKRSGISGIGDVHFPTHSQEAQRPWYSLIQLPGKSLDEAIAIAKDIKEQKLEVLGQFVDFMPWELKVTRL